MDTQEPHPLTAARRGAVSVGVVGACGGVGASVLAAVLAAAAARRRMVSVLVDGDRDGAGLDVLLGLEDEPGLRWPDLHSARGEVSGEQVLPLLPGWRGTHVLSADRVRPGTLPHEVPHDVLVSLLRSCDVVVHDIARHEIEVWAGLCTSVVVVGRCDLLSVAGAAALRARLSDLRIPLGLVVRGPVVGQVDPHDVARASGLDLWGELVTDKAMLSAVERGDGPSLEGLPARGRRGRQRVVRGRARRQVGGLAEVLLDHVCALVG